ncbi:MAG: hypothetical protein Q4B88_04275 [Moraxella sp.]|nr:hypothetical protein [Moraxella sp.]
MQLLQKLINSTQFSQAQPIWQDDLGEAVFEPFYTCMLADMTSDTGFAAYDSFVTATHEPARAALETGSISPILAVFWEKEEYARLRQKIVDNTFADDATLGVALPLAVHTGMTVLQEQASLQGLSVADFIKSRLGEFLPFLPAWTGDVVDADRLATLNVEQLLSASIEDTYPSSDTSHTPLVPPVNTAPADDDSFDTPPPPKKNNSSKALALGGLLGLLAVAGGGYYFLSKEDAPVSTPAEAPAEPLVVQTLPPSRLSITVDANGELYACHAELGSNALADSLIGLLQNNFQKTLCVVDINESLSQNMAGMDGLPNVIALLKSVPHATLEMQGDNIYLNAPNPNDASRLVSGIGALMAGVSVSLMPPLDIAKTTQDSITAATTALNALATPANLFELARAASLQHIDTTTGTIPEINRPVLSLIATHLKNTPDIKLIIAAHRDDIGDALTARTQTQMFADAIKAELVAHGALEQQIVTVGAGSDFPAADNQTEAGRFKNKRVEFLAYDDAVLQALNTPVTPTSPTMPPSANVTDIPPQTAPAQAAAGGMPAQMPAQPVGAGMHPTYTVIDGKIVEAGTGAVMQSMPPAITAEQVQPVQTVQEPVYTTPAPSYAPAPSYPAASTLPPIDEALLRPIGSEPVVGGSAVNRANP